jgi:acyl carrier protein
VTATEGFSKMSHREYVIGAVATIIDVDPHTIDTSLRLYGDLDATSLDFLEILFLIADDLKLEMDVNTLVDHLRGPVPREAFSDDQGVLSAEGLAQVERVLPQFQRDPGGRRPRVPELFALLTVDDLTKLVDAQVEKGSQLRP